MKIDDLIATLQRVREASGNVDVAVTSFCGTNQGHVLFDIKPPKRPNFAVKKHINGHGQFCLSVEISQSTKASIKKGVAEMKELGYRYFCSQYVSVGESPREGLSVCEWHNPW